jgi:hypothetical protein
MSIRRFALALTCIVFSGLAPASLYAAPPVIRVPLGPLGHCPPYTCRSAFPGVHLRYRYYCHLTKPRPIEGRLAGRPYCACTMTYQRCW